MIQMIQRYSGFCLVVVFAAISARAEVSNQNSKAWTVRTPPPAPTSTAPTVVSGRRGNPVNPLEIQNLTSTPLNVALTTFVPDAKAPTTGTWRSEGWWPIAAYGALTLSLGPSDKGVIRIEALGGYVKLIGQETNFFRTDGRFTYVKNPNGDQFGSWGADTALHAIHGMRDIPGIRPALGYVTRSGHLSVAPANASVGWKTENFSYSNKDKSLWTQPLTPPEGGVLASLHIDVKKQFGVTQAKWNQSINGATVNLQMNDIHVVTTTAPASYEGTATLFYISKSDNPPPIVHDDHEKPETQPVTR